MDLLIALWGCAEPPLADWHGCLTDGVVSADDPSAGPLSQPGDGALLTVGTRWGGLEPFVSDSSHWFELVVTLPSAREGTFPVDGHTATSAAPTAIGNRDLRGVVRIVALEPTSARVALDVAVGGRRPRRVQGELSVPRCPSGR